MREVWKFFKLFYGMKGAVVIVLPVISIFVGLVESFSIGILVPILEGPNATGSISLFYLSLFEKLGIADSLGWKLVMMVSGFWIRGIMLLPLEAYVAKVVTSLEVDKRCEQMNKLLASDYQFFISRESGHFNNYITIIITRTTSAFSSFGKILSAAGFAVAFISFPLYEIPGYTIVLLLSAIPLLPLIRKFNTSTRLYSFKQAKLQADFQSLFMQTLGNFKYLKATGACAVVFDKLSQLTKKFGRTKFMVLFLQSSSRLFFEPIGITLLACVIYHMVAINGKSLVAMGLLLFLIKRAIDRLLGLQQTYRKFLGCHGAFEIYNELSGEIEEQQEIFDDAKPSPDFNKDLEFKNVSFAYAGAANVLSNINFIIRPNSTSAFVGSSGSGKSTLVTMLTGILKPTEGEIYIGENSFSQLNQRALRNKIGYVTQESVIFSDSIRNNISLWQEGDEQQLEVASKRAHIHEFIEDSPQKYASMLGDNGLNISGGQRQRISIARELYKDAKLLVFDEATSALDSGSEKEIQSNIDELKGEKTIAIVAHRLSTVRNADVIYVLKDGAIEESGSWQELVDKGGEFSRMLELQGIQNASD